MMSNKSILIIASLFICLTITVIAPRTVIALTRVVEQNPAQCPSDTIATPCYANIQDAIDAAAAGDSIQIRPGTYLGNFTINKSISISGDEAARTFLSGGGSGTVLTIDGVATSISIRRLAFIQASTGILARNSPSITITNNLFQVGVGGTAVQLNAATTTEITNNTFYQNGTGILSDSSTVNIKNNIFASQLTTAISSNVSVIGVLNNEFFNCGTIGPAVVFDAADTANYKGNIKDEDPLFVNASPSDVTQRDFHLRPGSPCIDAGNPSVGMDSVNGTTADIGAYGGPTADTILFRVSGVAITPSSTSIAVSWNPNNSYTTKGYRVYYGISPGVYNGTGAAEGNSPIHILSSATTTAILSSLGTSTASLTAPALDQPSPLDQSLVLNWSAVPGATGYRVFYGTTSPPTTPVDVDGSQTTYTLSGLTNGQTYFVAVSAFAQPTFYISVTAFDTEGETPTTGVAPGIAHESIYSSETSTTFGNVMESGLSNIVSDFAEAVIPYPALLNSHQGCFIATAAYGYYSAPEVRALREFRDRYLIKHGMGSAFVEWYYRNGPAAAAYLNAHPGYKPVVRAALMPAVGAALFMTRTSLMTKGALLLLALLTGVMIDRFAGKSPSCGARGEKSAKKR